MKKALLHIFFLGMLLFNAGATHAAALPHWAMEADTVQKAVKECTQAENTTVFQKEYVLTDLDDSEEFDFDEQETSITGKEYFSYSTFLSKALTTNFISKSSCDKIYYHANFSRLPRYNYISLRVFRI